MGIRCLVIDDSVQWRKTLSQAASGLGGVDHVETAPNGDIGLQRMAQNPAHLVLLEIGLTRQEREPELLRTLRSGFPDTNIVVTGSSTDESGQLAVRALGMGALEFIQKPDCKKPGNCVPEIKDSLNPVLKLLSVRLAMGVSGTARVEPDRPKARTRPPSRIPAKTPASGPTPIRIVVIGVSTGGPVALAQLIPLLPHDFALPILIVQHMPREFTHALAGDLDRKSPLEVVEAKDGMLIANGQVIIAKGGSHMEVEWAEDRRIITLNQRPPVNSCRPSADVLFQSVAKTYGTDGVLAVILTGMGADGTEGVRALKQRNCHCITQSRESCLIYGMPRAVDQAGLSDESLDIEEMAGRMILLATRANPSPGPDKT